MYEHIHKHKNYTGIIIKQKYNEEKVHGSLLIHLKLKKKVMYVKIIMWRKNLIFTGCLWYSNLFYSSKRHSSWVTTELWKVLYIHSRRTLLEELIYKSSRTFIVFSQLNWEAFRKKFQSHSSLIKTAL